MPELPEVETTRLGVRPWIKNKMVSGVSVRCDRLRWPVPDLNHLLVGSTILDVQRRAKYLLLSSSHQGALIIHLGMSGSLRIAPIEASPGPHDHIDIRFEQYCLRMRDPRRFGAVLWSTQPLAHPLLKSLGPEPLSEAFDIDYLWWQAKRRKIAIKSLLMDGKVVVGVGNIYATEALFMAGIHPNRPCNRISKQRLARLLEAVKRILTQAIAKGGTTLRDFQREDGQPGYFRLDLRVYGRAGETCHQCGRKLKSLKINQRASAYCGYCQR
jgi:formamidopyrimidine-DNA glycosylase